VDFSDAYDRAKGVKSNHPKPQTVHGSHVEHLWLHFPKGSLYADDEITVNFKDSFNAITDFLKAKYVKSTTAEQALLCPSQGPFRLDPTETGDVLVINAHGETIATLPRNIIDLADTELPPLEDIQLSLAEPSADDLSNPRQKSQLQPVQKPQLQPLKKPQLQPFQKPQNESRNKSQFSSLQKPLTVSFNQSIFSPLHKPQTEPFDQSLLSSLCQPQTEALTQLPSTAPDRTLRSVPALSLQAVS
jgi:hypothetical protein